MFPNHPSFVEKRVQTKQEEIAREVRSLGANRLPRNPQPEIRPKQKYRMWVLVSLLIGVAWLFSAGV